MVAKGDDPDPPSPRAGSAAALILANLDLVSKHARSIAPQLRNSGVSRDELYAQGYLMLVTAATRFDSARGDGEARRQCSAFEAYARKIVRGGMWDMGRRREYRERSHAELTTTIVNASGNPDANTQAGELAGVVMDAFNRVLSVRERFVVSAYYTERFGATRFGLGDMDAIGAHLTDVGLLAVTGSRASRIHRIALGKMRAYMTVRGLTAAA